MYLTEIVRTTWRMLLKLKNPCADNVFFTIIPNNIAYVLAHDFHTIYYWYFCENHAKMPRK